MLFAIILFAALLIITLLVYFKTTPEHMDTRSSTLYNMLILTLALLACLIIYAYTYLNNGLSIQRAMLSLLAYLKSLLAITIVLIAGGLFRNHIIFRKKK